MAKARGFTPLLIKHTHQALKNQKYGNEKLQLLPVWSGDILPKLDRQGIAVSFLNLFRSILVFDYNFAYMWFQMHCSRFF